MELKGQDKETGMPSSLGYNLPHIDSSHKVPPASVISALGERKRDHLHQTAAPQTLEHHPLPLNLQHQSLEPTRESDVIPDPAPIAATGATSSTPTPSTSISRSPPPPPPAAASTIITTESISSVRYRECLRNHAASMGGLVVDGCGEFMPSGEEGTPEALKCAACECHRNFHRKEIDGEPPQCTPNCFYKNNNQRNTLALPQQLPTSLPPTQASLHHRYPHGFSISAPTIPTAPIMMTFGGGGGSVGAESSSEDLNIFQSNLQAARSMRPSSLKNKRFRTKFTQEQKDKMMEFAERLGWKIQKQDEQEVQQFCSRVGVKRKVFKVWMHNNKQSMKKKQM